MFKGAYQRKLLTILYSGGSNPLELWDIQVKNGWTRRVKDEDLGTIVFEIAGTNVATAYIVCPPGPRNGLAISLPFINMFIKNLKRYFTFEIQILDDKQMRRRFRFSNYQRATKVRPFACSVPLALKPGWNQMQINLTNFTMRAYGTKYLETQRVQIHANCRIRRVYFSDRVYADEELPRDYRVCLDVRQQQAATKKPSVVQTSASEKVPLVRGPSILKAPTPVQSETLVTETSYKSSTSVKQEPSTSTGKDTSSKSIHSMAKVSSIDHEQDTFVNLTVEEMETRKSLSNVQEIQEPSERVEEGEQIMQLNAEDESAPVEQAQEEAEPEVNVVVETAAEGELPEGEVSPRTEGFSDTEYAESEPPVIVESDIEETLEPDVVDQAGETALPTPIPDPEAAEVVEPPAGE